MTREIRMKRRGFRRSKEVIVAITKFWKVQQLLEAPYAGWQSYESMRSVVMHDIQQRLRLRSSCMNPCSFIGMCN